MASSSESETQWELYYWGPGVQGRGEYVRLMFVEAGVEWIEKHNVDKDAIVNFVYKGGNTGFPVFACPVVKKGDFVLSQTTAILYYLGEKFNLAPKNPEDAAHGLSIALGAADFLMEGQNAFHPVDTHGRYLDQKEEADKEAAKFASGRVGKWLNTFEKQLAYNNEGRGFFVGDTITYVDLAVFQVFLAAQAQFPEAVKNADVPVLKAFVDRIAQRPRIAAYLPKRYEFGGDSMM